MNINPSIEADLGKTISSKRLTLAVSGNMATDVSGSDNTTDITLSQLGAGAKDDIYLSKIRISIYWTSNTQHLTGWGSQSSALTNGFYIQYSDQGHFVDLIGSHSNRIKELRNLYQWLDAQDNRRQISSKVCWNWKMTFPYPIKLTGTDKIRIVRGVDNYTNGSTSDFRITGLVYE